MRRGNEKSEAGDRLALAAGVNVKAPKAVICAARGKTAELAAEIEKELKEYEQLEKTQAKELRICSLHDLRLAPIRYRIAAHMTVEGFARSVRVHSRQIARYESEDYQ